MDEGVILRAIDECKVRRRLFVAGAPLAGNSEDYGLFGNAYIHFPLGILTGICRIGGF